MCDGVGPVVGMSDYHQLEVFGSDSRAEHSISLHHLMPITLTAANSENFFSGKKNKAVFVRGLKTWSVFKFKF